MLAGRGRRPHGRGCGSPGSGRRLPGGGRELPGCGREPPSRGRGPPGRDNGPVHTVLCNAKESLRQISLVLSPFAFLLLRALGWGPPAIQRADEGFLFRLGKSREFDSIIKLEILVSKLESPSTYACCYI